MQPKIQILGTELVFKGNYLTVMKRRFRNKLGQEAAWEFIERLPIVYIFPITTDGKVVLIKQFRLAQERYVIEMPAGLCDRDGEDPLDTAKRELLEETGYEAENWHKLRRAPRGAAAAIAGPIHMYFATGARKAAESSPEPDEDIEVFEAPFDRMISAVLSEPDMEIDFGVLALHNLAKYWGFGK